MQRQIDVQQQVDNLMNTVGITIGNQVVKIREHLLGNLQPLLWEHSRGKIEQRLQGIITTLDQVVQGLEGQDEHIVRLVEDTILQLRGSLPLPVRYDAAVVKDLVNLVSNVVTLASVTLSSYLSKYPHLEDVKKYTDDVTKMATALHSTLIRILYPTYSTDIEHILREKASKLLTEYIQKLLEMDAQLKQQYYEILKGQIIEKFGGRTRFAFFVPPLFTKSDIKGLAKGILRSTIATGLKHIAHAIHTYFSKLSPQRATQLLTAFLINSLRHIELYTRWADSLELQVKQSKIFESDEQWEILRTITRYKEDFQNASEIIRLLLQRLHGGQVEASSPEAAPPTTGNLYSDVKLFKVLASSFNGILFRLHDILEEERGGQSLPEAFKTAMMKYWDTDKTLPFWVVGHLELTLIEGVSDVVDSVIKEEVVTTLADKLDVLVDRLRSYIVNQYEKAIITMLSYTWGKPVVFGSQVDLTPDIPIDVGELAHIFSKNKWRDVVSGGIGALKSSLRGSAGEFIVLLSVDPQDIGALGTTRDANIHSCFLTAAGRMGIPSILLGYNVGVLFIYSAPQQFSPQGDVRVVRLGDKDINIIILDPDNINFKSLPTVYRTFFGFVGGRLSSAGGSYFTTTKQNEALRSISILVFDVLNQIIDWSNISSSYFVPYSNYIAHQEE